MKKAILQSPWIDLYLVIFFTFLAIIFILIPPFDQIPLRIPFALILLLFLPGYVLIAALFPGRDIKGVERFTLSVGLSIVITVFDGFIISVTEWRFRPTSIVVSLSIIILFFVIITFLVRSRVPLDKRFIPDIRPFIESVRTKEKQTDIEKVLIIAMVGSIIIASGMLIYAKLIYEEEKFTALYILGPDGKARDYQTDIFVGNTTSITVGVENYEHEAVSYTLQVLLDDGVLTSYNIKLDHNEKWIQNVSFVPDILGEGLKLEFILYKENTDEEYRSVFLWVISSIDYGQISNVEDFLIHIPRVVNGNMEEANGWKFEQEGNFTGNYVDNTYVSKSHSYEIILSADTNKGDFGSIYQNINTSKKGLAVLSFDVKDSENSDEGGNYLKRVLLNNKVIWEDDVSGDEGWKHVETLIRLSEKNCLVLGVYTQEELINDSITAWWDNVRFDSLTTVNIKDSNINLTLGVPSDFTVSVENYEPDYTEYDLEIRVDNTPIKLKRIGLAGRENWEEKISFTPEMLGSDIKIEALLYKYGEWDEPYRSDEVLVSSFIDYDNIDTALPYMITPPEILNSDMEYTSIWKFIGTNITGLYTDYTSRSPVVSFEMELMPGIHSISGDAGSMYQDIFIPQKGLVILAFNVKDSDKSDKSRYHKKQVLINDRIIWQDDVAGSEGWQHIEIPVILQCNNRLTMRLYERKSNSDDLKVWWDDIEFKVFPYQGEANDVEVEDEAEKFNYVPSLEIREEIVSIKADKTFTIDDNNYDGLSNEYLILKFKNDGIIDCGDAEYTNYAYTDNKFIRYKGTKYRLVDPSKADLLSDMIIYNKAKTMKINDTWDMGSDYTLSVKTIEIDKNNVWLELSGKDGEVVSDIFNEGDTFKYETEVGTVKNFELISFKIDSITQDDVKINELYSYSDSPHQVNIHDKYGEFEVDTITANSIIFNNINNIRFYDTMSVLNGRIKFNVAENKQKAYTYLSKTKPGNYKIEGHSHNMTAGNRVELTAYNFPAFTYDLDTDTSYESLDLFFSNDNTVNAGNAIYIATKYKNKIGLFGEFYQVHNVDHGTLYSQILLDENEKSMRVGESYLLKNGYLLSVSALEGMSTVMELSKDGNLIESRLCAQGDRVIFSIPYDDKEAPIFEFKIENIVGDVVFIDFIKQYTGNPIELIEGNRYGDFKITEITDTKIVMENVNSITINDGKSILDGWIEFDVSDTTATPYINKRFE